MIRVACIEFKRLLPSRSQFLSNGVVNGNDAHYLFALFHILTQKYETLIFDVIQIKIDCVIFIFNNLLK
jgi:hypothetical protein